MDVRHLQNLLAQEESITREFKQELHAIDHPSESARHRHELARDLLALANGNASTAGETAYLIFGVGDSRGPDGRRPLFTIPNPLPDRQRLLSLVNTVCTPRLEELLCEPVLVEGQRLFVVTIPPTQYVHETNRSLTTPTRQYTEHVVFIREGQSIKIANAGERDAIRTMKRRRYVETYSVSPRVFGALDGAIVGGTVAQIQMERQQAQPGERLVAGLVGTFAGAVLGALIGNAYRNLVDVWRLLRFTPPPRRYAFAAGYVVFVAAFQVIVGRALRALGHFIRPKRSPSSLA
jgi:hypothetical protein